MLCWFSYTVRAEVTLPGGETRQTAECALGAPLVPLLQSSFTLPLPASVELRDALFCTPLFRCAVAPFMITDVHRA